MPYPRLTFTTIFVASMRNRAPIRAPIAAPITAKIRAMRTAIISIMCLPSSDFLDLWLLYWRGAP